MLDVLLLELLILDLLILDHLLTASTETVSIMRPSCLGTARIIEHQSWRFPSDMATAFENALALL